MALVDLAELLAHAQQNDYVVAAFEVSGLESVKTIIDAAEINHSPVALSLSHSDEELEMLLPSIEAAAKRSSTAVVILSEQTAHLDTAITSINRGSNALALKLSGDVALKQEIVSMAVDCGVPIGLALQRVHDQLDGKFLQEVGASFVTCHIECLNAESMAELAHLQQRVAVPVIAKLKPDDLDMLSSAVQLLASASKVEKVLAECRLWLPIEHLIIFNVEGIDEQQAKTMMAEGRRILCRIPGVRYVFTGEAVKQDAGYRYTWLVRFVHENVIASYRDHPEHVRFADKLFRPVAGGRLSIDYREVID